MTTSSSLSPSQVSSTVESEQSVELPVLPLTFIPINEYTTYRGEVAITEGDLVFHFFITEEANERSNPAPKLYWLEIFPSVLQDVSQHYFNAKFPRLKAAYTEEQASWWLRAFGFGQVLDPHKFAYKFLEALDAALDRAITSSA